MDWLGTLLPAVVGFIGGNLTQLRRSGRLRSAVVNDVGVYDRMPDGSAKAILGAHIERQVLYLVAEEEPSPAEEARKRRLALGLLLGSIVVGLVATTAGAEYALADWIDKGVLVACTAAAGIGISLRMEAATSRRRRKREKRSSADLSTVVT